MKKLCFTVILAAFLVPTIGVTGVAAKSPPAKSQKDNGGKVMLRDAVTVKSKLVRLGDLFINAGDNADVTVAYAPAPGKQALFDARWLYRLARSYGLQWKPLGIQDQILVQRAGQAISREEIEDTILAALSKYGAEKSMSVELSNRLMRLYVPTGALAQVGVEDISYEPRTGRFSAIIKAPANDPRAERNRVTGRLHEITEIPVLVRRMLKKEVITKRDIKWVRTRNDRIRRGTVLELDELIGMAVKRGLRADRPIQTSAIQRPILVAKGSLVTIILKAPKMTLTARGKSLDNGADGDTVRITNSQSKKVIEAEVTGTARVAVVPTGFMAMN